MESIEANLAIRGAAMSLKKRRCPQCNSFLFLELEQGEGYWWSCLMCGWHQPAEGAEHRSDELPSD